MLDTFIFLIFILLPIGFVIRDWKFHDRRTKKYRYCTKALILVWIFFGSLSAYYHWEQNSVNEDLKNDIKNLKKTIAPFSDVAKSNFPELDEKNALEKLRLQLYHPRIRLKDFVERIIKQGGMSDSDIVKLFSLTRQLVEYENTEIQYPVLKFYCDWILSSRINESNTGYLMLSNISKVVCSNDPIIKANIPMEISKLLSINKFRGQLQSLYASNDISTILFTRRDNWMKILSLVFKEIIGKVIEFPPDVENRKDYVGIIYKEMQEMGTSRSREFLIPQKLWLSDDVESELSKKGDIHWCLESSIGAQIVGKLMIIEKR